MQWTDRIRQVKIILVLAAIIIAVASLIVSNNLVKKLADEEHNKMEVWAEAMRSLNKADENTDLNLVLKVINENNTIPGASSTRIAFGLQSYKLFFILVLQMPKISCIYRLKWHCFTMLQHLSAV